MERAGRAVSAVLWVLAFCQSVAARFSTADDVSIWIEKGSDGARMLAGFAALLPIEWLLLGMVVTSPFAADLLYEWRTDRRSWFKPRKKGPILDARLTSPGGSTIVLEITNRGLQGANFFAIIEPEQWPRASGSFEPQSIAWPHPWTDKGYMPIAGLGNIRVVLADMESESGDGHGWIVRGSSGVVRFARIPNEDFFVSVLTTAQEPYVIFSIKVYSDPPSGTIHQTICLMKSGLVTWDEPKALTPGKSLPTRRIT